MDYGYNMCQMPYTQYASIGDMYRQQAMQPQQSFTKQLQSSVFGKMIQSPNDIMPADIPMNGTPCFFPMQDGSAIYAKMWNADGTISTMRFIPEQPAPQEPTQLDRIEAMLANMVKPKETADE